MSDESPKTVCRHERIFDRTFSDSYAVQHECLDCELSILASVPLTPDEVRARLDELHS